MPAPLLVIKNCSHEGPGLFERVLHEEKVPYDIVDLDGGDPFPSHENYGALLVMGGPDSANDDTPKMKTELERIRAAVDAQVPYLGVCLGLQTLVKACGGSVRRNETKEIGLRDPKGEIFSVEVTPEGSEDPLLAGLEPTLPIFHLHGETVDLTDDMTLVGTGLWCRNQIVRVRPKAYGMQGHYDVTRETLQVWMEKDADLRGIPAEALLNDWNEVEEECERIGRTIFRNFVRIAGLAA